MNYLSLFSSLLLLLSCHSSPSGQKMAKALKINLDNDSEWRELWYDGNAEVNVYETQQARYQDVHSGKTVLIFVTEDFLTDKQVKNETYTDKASTSVLKTNLIRKFETGIYDYSMMTSVFTPVDHETHPHTLKITLSSQDWCGQSFMQLNHAKNKYQVNQFSYFEKEGDGVFNVDDHLAEDEIFNQIRFNPAILPTGSNSILPSTAFSRLKHVQFKPYEAILSQEKYDGNDFDGDNLEVYKIIYPEFERTLEIVYEKNFPYAIIGWKDAYPAISGENRTSIFRRISSKRLPYWSKHNLEDGFLRKELGL